MKKLFLIIIAIIIVTIPAGCSGAQASSGSGFNDAVSPSVISSTAEQEANAVVETPFDIEKVFATASVEYDDDDVDSGTDIAAAAQIMLKGSAISITGYGVKVNGTTVMITSAGTYIITGTLDDGQIKIFTGDKGSVRLVLNNAHINCSTSAPIYAVSAEKTVIILAEGTENSVADGAIYIFEDKATDEPCAAIFAKDDLTITGAGLLTVNARYNNGIQSKDDLKITGGRITINARNDGIKGKDSVAVKNGTIIVEAGGDGVQSNNDADEDKGFIAISGGTFIITAGADGIQAETALNISGGNLTIASGGSSAAADNSRVNQHTPSGIRMQNNAAATENTISAKGLKAGTAVVISGASIELDCMDDGINANKYVAVISGDITIASGDDAIHANTSLVIDGGTIAVTKSYEGLESKLIVLDGGDIHLVSDDDGINVNGGSEGFPMVPGNRFTDNASVKGYNPTSNTSGGADNYYLTIKSGYLSIDAGGDGIDVNGPVKMTGGTVIVNGPTNNGNGALDYTGSFVVNGGYLIAAGSSGMAQAPDDSSTQNSVMVNFPAQQAATTLFRIETSSGANILTFEPKKTYQSVVVSSPDIVEDETYIVFSGGSSTGKAVDGIYSDGEYSGGTQITTLTISDMVTVHGTAGGGPGGGSFPGGRMWR